MAKPNFRALSWIIISLVLFGAMGLAEAGAAGQQQAAQNTPGTKKHKPSADETSEKLARAIYTADALKYVGTETCRPVTRRSVKPSTRGRIGKR